MIVPALAKRLPLNGLIGRRRPTKPRQGHHFDQFAFLAQHFDRARVLTAVIAAKPNDEALKLVVTSAAGITSDYDKAQVLIATAKIVKDEDVRKMLVEVARGIRSDYERGNVLSAAIK